jgi:hypothetical protein
VKKFKLHKESDAERLQRQAADKIGSPTGW